MPVVAAASTCGRWASVPDLNSTESASSASAVLATSDREPLPSLQAQPPGAEKCGLLASLRWQVKSQSRQPSAPTSPLAEARALIAKAVLATLRLVTIGQDASPRTVSRRNPIPRRAISCPPRPVAASPMTRKPVQRGDSKSPPLAGCIGPSEARLRPTLSRRTTKASRIARPTMEIAGLSNADTDRFGIRGGTAQPLPHAARQPGRLKRHRRHIAPGGQSGQGRRAQYGRQHGPIAAISSPQLSHAALTAEIAFGPSRGHRQTAATGRRGGSPRERASWRPGSADPIACRPSRHRRFVPPRAIRPPARQAAGTPLAGRLPSHARATIDSAAAAAAVAKGELEISPTQCPAEDRKASNSRRAFWNAVSRRGKSIT